MRSIPLAKPDIHPEDSARVQRVFASGMLVQGEEVAAFEREVAARCGRRHGIALSSGTAALVLALRALGLKPGQGLLCPALSWPSPAHAAAMLGAWLHFVDIDPLQWNAVGSGYAAWHALGARFAIAIPQFGNPCSAPDIAAGTADLVLIEDAACALGSQGPTQPAGSLGRISCLSFHPRKLITTGEGGMCLCDEADLADHVRLLRNHGQRQPGTFVMAAGNYRMTEFQAALGRAQLQRLDAQIAKRRLLAARYRSALPALQFQQRPAGGIDNVQTMGALWPYDAASLAQARQRLAAEGIQTGRLSYALPHLPSLQAAQQAAPKPATASENCCPVAVDVAARGFALPLYPQMHEQDQDKVIAAVQAALAVASSA